MSHPYGRRIVIMVYERSYSSKTSIKTIDTGDYFIKRGLKRYQRPIDAFKQVIQMAMLKSSVTSKNATRYIEPLNLMCWAWTLSPYKLGKLKITIEEENKNDVQASPT